MKKILVLLLALVMCFGICACGGGESSAPSPEEQIVGEWVYDDETLTFEAEGKGFVANDSTEQSVVWLYNEEVGLYEITTSGYTYFGELIDKEGVETLILDDTMEFVKVVEEE